MKIVFCYHTTDYEYHLGIALLSAAAEALDVQTRLVIFREIAGRPSDTVEETVTRILENKPDIIAFSVMTFNWKKIQKVIVRLRPDFSGIIVIGGCHAMLCPEEVLSCQAIDAVCTGDGEKPIQELVRHTQSVSNDFFPHIEGMIFNKNFEQKPNFPWRNDHLDDYPYLSYEIFDKERDQPLSRKITGPFSFAGIFTLPLITSRGCPHKCSYCNNHSFMNILGGQKGYLRTYPVKRLFPEMKTLVEKYHPDFIDFMDEMFLKNKQWMHDFCNEYTKEIGLPFSINIRIDQCSEDVTRILAKAGLKVAFFGLECGDEDYRSKYLDRHMSNAQILKGAEILKKYGILIITYNMFGMPFETPEILQKTISLNREIQPDAIAPFVYQPLPQTKLASLAYEQNFVTPPPDDRWDYLAPALDSDILPATYVQEQVALFRQEFNSPEKVQAFVSKINTFTGKN